MQREMASGEPHRIPLPGDDRRGVGEGGGRGVIPCIREGSCYLVPPGIPTGEGNVMRKLSFEDNYIPVTDSVSTLILTLGAVLGWAVLGWAGDFKMLPPYVGGTVDCRYRYDGNGALITDCKMREEPTCYQRMREAMRSMEAFLRKQVVIPAEDYARIKDPWNATVKDCVEGGK